jgi:hypothetical protein
LEAVLEQANRLTTTFGEQGWEIVGSSVQRTQVAHRFKEYDRGGDHYFEWSIVCTLKRLLPPGQTGIAATVAIKPENRDPDGNLVEG